ncbi:MAG TPA: hypothetical protein VLC08_03375 [Chitinolyticbacter sp.]|uniref:hypothetical protein n=1 Tax=Chitinolyticbacter albus TaxID=2961951 RepID=UPI00210DFFED|nr:hypothetical protein [Chitinolyticbacter albus]HSC79373.1 hypothetical protein [Chitinolyticbacter sp.]
MSRFAYTLYAIVVIVICTLINLSLSDDNSSSGRGWGSGRSSGSGWSSGGWHK